MTGPIITLLTDFGGNDGYVAAMKGVLLDLVPNGILVDAGHQIRPHDVRAGAWVLSQYAFLYPEDTIHVVVVDPDVGTERDALIATAGGQVFVAPNNGVLHWVSRCASGFEVRRIREDIHRPDIKSNTFHGRDVFAYAAGRLARGLDTIKDLTLPLDELVVPTWGEVRAESGAMVGDIIHIDRFGNLITSIHRSHLQQVGWKRVVIEAGKGTISRLHRTYGDVAKGMPVALIGSHDYLELAVCRGSAKEAMGLRRGDEVRIRKQ